MRRPAPSSVLQPSIHLQYRRSPCFPTRLLTNEVVALEAVTLPQSCLGSSHGVLLGPLPRTPTLTSQRVRRADKDKAEIQQHTELQERALDGIDSALDDLAVMSKVRLRPPQPLLPSRDGAVSGASVRLSHKPRLLSVCCCDLVGRSHAAPCSKAYIHLRR